MMTPTLMTTTRPPPQPPQMQVPTPPHHRLLPRRRRDAESETVTATHATGVMTGTLTAHPGVNTTIAIGPHHLHLHHVTGIIRSGGDRVPVLLHHRIGTDEEEVRILLPLDDRPRFHLIREGEKMDMTGGEGVLGEDMGEVTEGDHNI